MKIYLYLILMGTILISCQKDYRLPSNNEVIENIINKNYSFLNFRKYNNSIVNVDSLTKPTTQVIISDEKKKFYIEGNELNNEFMGWWFYKNGTEEIQFEFLKGVKNDQNLNQIIVYNKNKLDSISCFCASSNYTFDKDSCQAKITLISPNNYFDYSNAKLNYNFNNDNKGNTIMASNIKNYSTDFIFKFKRDAFPIEVNILIIQMNDKNSKILTRSLMFTDIINNENSIERLGYLPNKSKFHEFK